MKLTFVFFVLCGLTHTSANSHYQLKESYDHTNFFEKFSFFESNFTTSSYGDVDPTSGYVNYRNAEDAKSLGLIATQGSEMVLGVNHRNILDPKGKGRDSVRIESHQLYNHGLFVAEFTHMPKPGCGVWPAFWTYGDPWPTKGEVDIYENWNLADNNLITMHTGNSTEAGNCTINQRDMTNPIISSNCDVTYHDEKQGPNQSCGTVENHGQWGSKIGGVYAMEWSDEQIRIWSWSRSETPADIKRRQPSPRLWGTPHFAAGGSTCNINNVLQDQKIVLNIDFCGATAGNPDLWGQQCRNMTGYDTCIDYVANNPDAFADTFWKVKGIDVYENKGNVSKST